LWTRITGRPLRDARAELAGGVIVCRDISERKRDEEALLERLRFEALIGDLSARFAGLPDGEVDQEIDPALRAPGEVLAGDRVARWALDARGREFGIAPAWGEAAVGPAPRVVLVAQVPWASARLLRGEPVSFSHLAGLPAEAAADVGFYRDAGLQAALMLPLTLGGGKLGALSFACLPPVRA